MTNSNNSYLEEYKILHKNQMEFGSGAGIYFPEISLIIDYLRPKTVLDYGCGKAVLIKMLAERYPMIEFYGYDPSIPGRDVLPIKKVDLLINTDVLEHIPENILPIEVEKIATLSKNAFFILHHALAYTVLPNGVNAHCTVRPPIWYYKLLNKYYKTPYPLPSRKTEISACITFSPSIDFLHTYYNLVADKTLEDKVAYLENRVAHFEDRFVHHENRVAHFEDKFVCLENRVTHFEDKFVRLENRVTHLENRLVFVKRKLKFLINLYHFARRLKNKFYLTLRGGSRGN